MGRIEADTALESWLFGFRPCSGQGQFTLAYATLAGYRHAHSTYIRMYSIHDKLDVW